MQRGLKAIIMTTTTSYLSAPNYVPTNDAYDSTAEYDIAYPTAR